MQTLLSPNGHVNRHSLTQRLLVHRSFRNSLFILVLCAIFIGLIIVPVESVALKPRITSVEEGLWWAVTTVTGVGYGDFFPITTTGRIMGSILEIFGVMIFGLIIGIIGITMGKKQEEYYWFRLFERIDQLEEKVSALEKKSAYLIQDKK